VVYQQDNKNKIKMADLLGQMNTQMVSAYARSKQYEMPSVVAMAQAFDPVIDKAREVGEQAIIARKAGVEALEDNFDGTKKEKRQAIRTAGAEQMNIAKGEGTSSSGYTLEQLAKMLADGTIDQATYDAMLEYATPGIGYSPLKQQNTPPKESSRFVDTTTADYLIEKGPTRPDYKAELNKLVTQPNITELTIKNFGAQKEVVEQAINAVVENPAAQEQTIAFMNALQVVNQEEKEIKNLVVENAPNISRGAEESSTKILANYLNPANEKIMALDPSTNTYQYITQTPEGNITKEIVLEVLNTATTNDEAKASYLKSTNSIIKDERDATTNKPKDMNYFNTLAKNIVEANPNKIIDLIYGDIREGGNFADDLRQNPEMLGLPDELKEQTYNAIINPNNPNFNRDVTNGLLQQYFALDFKKTYDSVSNMTQAKTGSTETDSILNKYGIDPNLFE
jgi:hypothetical protein